MMTRPARMALQRKLQFADGRIMYRFKRLFELEAHDPSG